MKREFHPEARLELNAAVDYYEERAGLGRDFFEEVQAAIESILDFPNAGSPLSARTRKWLTRRFPYAVIYQVKADAVRIIGIAHQKRKPGYWQDRLEEP